MNILLKCPNPYIEPNTQQAYGCGKCIRCNKTKGMNWAIRAYHEQIENTTSTFITLTYNEKNLKRTAIAKMCKEDRRGTLDQRDMQLFLKRLRKKYQNTKIRYLYCGEYGTKYWRPHYHIILWGINPKTITESEITKIWGKGYAKVDNRQITKNAIQYITGYANKQITANKAIYEDNNRAKPYIRASKGIGKEWALKNITNIIELQYIKYRKHKYPVPRYYIKLIKKQDGKTIKFKERNQYGIKTTIYKTLQDLTKHKTLTYYENMHTTRTNSINNWEEEYKNLCTKQEINEAQKYAKQNLKNITHKAIDETKQIHTKSTNDIIEYYKNKYKTNIKRLIKKGNNEKTDKINKPSYLNEKTYNKFKNIAKTKINNIISSPYGQRNKVDYA